MKIDIEWFVEGMCDTFRVMVGRELVKGPVQPFAGGTIFTDVSAHIGIWCDEEACLVMTVPEAVALDLVRATADRDVALGDPLVADTVGELLNMVVGSSQRRSPGRYRFSLPVVCKGKRHEVKMLTGGYSQKVSFVHAREPLTLYLVLGDAHADGPRG